MKQILPVVLLLAVLIGLAFFALRVEPVAPAPLRPGAEAVETGERDPRAELGGSGGGTSQARAATDARAGPGEPRRDGAPGTPRAPIREPEPGTRARLAVSVVDTAGAPIADAVVALESVGAAVSGRSFLTGSAPGARARTDERGEASLVYPVSVDGSELTAYVSFTVEHPEFLPFRAAEVATDAGRALATLERGAYVVVSGFVDDPGSIVADVEPTISFGGRLERDAWRRAKDGRLATSALPPGRHALLLTHVAADGTHYASALEAFELADTERKELHLRLLPARRIEGRLSFDVPRPVTAGRVLVALQSGGPASDAPRLIVERSADVAADGTFAIDGLPPLRGEIVAASDGWVSARLPTRDLERLGVTRADDAVIAEAQRRLGDLALAHQELDAGTDAGPLVLEMQPAARLAVLVEAPDGKPLAGARVAVLARVSWSVGVSEPWVGPLAATTDEHGRSTFRALPAGVHDVRIEHAGLVMPLVELVPGRPNRGTDRIARAALESGLERELTVRMERP